MSRVPYLAGYGSVYTLAFSIMNKMEEQILVVPRPVLFGLTDRIAFQGVRTDSECVASTLHALAAHGCLRRRGDVERDPGLKQPIPYCVLSRKGDRGFELFAYERLPGGGEQRLHGRVSLGLGGHMNLVPTLDDPAEVVVQEALREIREEVDIEDDSKRKPTILGIINDDRDDVGRVHLGILLELELNEDASVRVRETTELDGYWVPVHILSDPVWRNRMEGWAHLVIDVFLQREAHTVPA